MKHLALCASSVAIAVALSTAASAQPDVKKVIFDQDADGITGARPLGFRPGAVQAAVR
jgi:hypothetical protein